MKLWIDNALGISISEIEAGIKAAETVFTAKGIPASKALSEDNRTWEEAEKQALAAAYEGWHSLPEHVKLILVKDSEKDQNESD